MPCCTTTCILQCHRQDQSQRNAGLAAHDAAAGRVTLSIAEARERAMAAMSERRAEEKRLEVATKHEKKLQDKYDIIESLNTKLEEVEKDIDELTERVVIQRAKTAKAAAPNDIKNVDDTLLLIETQAVDELNDQQKDLPVLSDADTDIERAMKEILTKKWEMEVAITRRQLAQSQFDELKTLEDEGASKRRARLAEEEDEAKAAQAERDRDLKVLAEKRKRVDDLLAAEKAKRESADQAAARQKEETRKRAEKEAKERAAKAQEIKIRWMRDEEVRSGAEEKRRAQDAADQAYEASQLARRNGDVDKAAAEKAARHDEIEQHRMENPHAMFGGSALRSSARVLGTTQTESTDGEDDDVHPMVALMKQLGRDKKKQGLTHLCAPPNTRM